MANKLDTSINYIIIIIIIITTTIIVIISSSTIIVVIITKLLTLFPLKTLPCRMMTILFLTDTPMPLSCSKSFSVPKFAYTISASTFPLAEKPKKTGNSLDFSSSSRRT